MKILIWIILIAVALFFVNKFRSLFKMPKVGAIALFTGGVKCGKSTNAVNLVKQEIKGRLFRYKIACFFCRLFRKPYPEKPLLYSNVPLLIRGVKIVPLTRELIMRQKRFAYGSVIYVNEAGLLMNKDIYQDQVANMQVTLFNKLIGHETKGGVLIYDSQAISDLPAPCRRCISQYFYVHHVVKWIPFFLVAYVREDRFSEDGTVVNVNQADVEDSLKRVLIRKSVWKSFDAYCYSSLTDNLPVADKEVEVKSLKMDHIVSFDNLVQKVAGGNKNA